MRQTEMEFKKQAVDLTDLAVGILILGIVVSIGATILINVRDSQLTELDAVTTLEEAVTGSNATAVELEQAWFNTITGVQNATDGSVVESGNYTVTVDPVSGKGQFLVVGSEFDGAPLEVNYTSYDTSQANWALPNSAATGVGEFGNWFSIIVIVGVAAVILALIFMAFGKRDGAMDASY